MGPKSFVNPPPPHMYLLVVLHSLTVGWENGREEG